jgi:hypothetical protein
MSDLMRKSLNFLKFSPHSILNVFSNLGTTKIWFLMLATKRAEYEEMYGDSRKRQGESEGKYFP